MVLWVPGLVGNLTSVEYRSSYGSKPDRRENTSVVVLPSNNIGLHTFDHDPWYSTQGHQRSLSALLVTDILARGLRPLVGGKNQRSPTSAKSLPISQPRPAPYCFSVPLPQFDDQPHISHRTHFPGNTTLRSPPNFVLQLLNDQKLPCRKHRRSFTTPLSPPLPNTTTHPIYLHTPPKRTARRWPLHGSSTEAPGARNTASTTASPSAHRYKPCRRLRLRSNSNPAQCPTRRYGLLSAIMACTKALGTSEMRRTHCARVNFSSRPSLPLSLPPTLATPHRQPQLTTTCHEDTTSPRAKRKICSSTRRSTPARTSTSNSPRLRQTSRHPTIRS